MFSEAQYMYINWIVYQYHKYWENVSLEFDF